MAVAKREWWIDCRKYCLWAGRAWGFNLQLDYEGINFTLIAGWFGVSVFYLAPQPDTLDLARGYSIGWDAVTGQDLVSGGDLFRKYSTDRVIQETIWEWEKRVGGPA